MDLDGGDPLFEPLRQARTPPGAVFVHPTSPTGHERVDPGRPSPKLEFLFDSARAASHLVFAGVLLRHPGIRWVFTNGGGALPLLADRGRRGHGAKPGL